MNSPCRDLSIDTSHDQFGLKTIDFRFCGLLGPNRMFPKYENLQYCIVTGNEYVYQISAFYIVCIDAEIFAAKDSFVCLWFDFLTTRS